VGSQGKALPEGGGPGEGAAGSPVASEAPTKVVCRDYAYRYNIKTVGRTKYVVIDTRKWEIVEPTRKERSKMGAHGKDVYCLPESAWGEVIVVELERSNTGKLHYEVLVPHAGFEKYKLELEALLALAGSFDEMEEVIVKYVAMRRMLRV
jgi:hypothetical protein